MDINAISSSYSDMMVAKPKIPKIPGSDHQFRAVTQI